MRRVLLALVVLAVVAATAGSAIAQSWPRATADNVIQISKEVGLEDPGGLPDSQGIHLHRGHMYSSAGGMLWSAGTNALATRLP
jgi:hypothetical protein